PGAFQDAIDVYGRAAEQFPLIRSVGHEPADLDGSPDAVDGGQPGLRRQLDDSGPIDVRHDVAENVHGVGPLLAGLVEGSLQIRAGGDLQGNQLYLRAVRRRWQGPGEQI